MKTTRSDALAAALALAVSPTGFSVGEFTNKVRAMTGQGDHDYAVRQGAYDLRKLRAKELINKPDRSRRYHVPQPASRIIAGILTPFIAKAMQAYTHSQARASLVDKGRLAMERLAREVHQAVPNSLHSFG